MRKGRVLSRINTVLSSQVLQQIQSYQCHLGPAKINKNVWKENADGILTARSLYKFLTTNNDNRASRKWNWIWKLKCPQKIRFLCGFYCMNAYRFMLILVILGQQLLVLVIVVKPMVKRYYICFGVVRHLTKCGRHYCLTLNGHSSSTLDTKLDCVGTLKIRRGSRGQWPWIGHYSFSMLFGQ